MEKSHWRNFGNRIGEESIVAGEEKQHNIDWAMGDEEFERSKDEDSINVAERPCATQGMIMNAMLLIISFYLPIIIRQAEDNAQFINEVIFLHN